MSLNHAQEEAIHFKNGPCLTLAGPGSGKTLTITRRTQNLIQEYRVSPSDILVVTFTKAAAMEMKSRFIKVMGGQKCFVTFGTFHAIFFAILKHAYHYRAENIVREEQKFMFMRDMIRKFHMEYEDENEFIQDILSEISTVKNARIHIEYYYATNCAEDIFRRIYTTYQEALKKSRLIDFDDMLLYTYELFTQRPDILAIWQKRYPYILVDEFQDINQIQYEIVKMMAAPNHNLFVVGDDDQSIYRFRGATPGIMKEFTKDYPTAKRILLDINYRSNSSIVERALNLISYNKERFEKNITAAMKEDGKVQIRVFANQREENIAVIQSIQNHISKGGTYENIAILFRTNTQPHMLMEQLLEYNIPFKSKDKIPNIYDHWIAKDIFTYLRIAMGSRARADVLQIMNRPKRYIGRDSLEETTVAFDVWADYYEKMEQSWITERIERLEYDCNMLSKMAPYAAINYIRKGIGYEEYLKEYAEYRHIRIEELIEVLDELQAGFKEYKLYPEWLQHIEDYRKEIERLGKRQQEEKNRVSLSTLHSAKGLEYEKVYIIDVNEKIIPYKKAVLEVDIEEERRMFYVGMTRAKSELYLFAVKQLNNHDMDVSRFLQEVRVKYPLETVDEQRRRKN